MTTPSTTRSSPEEARRRRSAGLDGILVVDKPAGPTSHDIVALVRRLAATRRVGHGGTLDPFATGVLVLFLGKATRLAEYHLKAPKRYRATVCFGASSATDDLEGELTPAEGPPPDRAAVEAALDQFRGPILQVPPTYSAVKVGGRRAYAVARRGGEPALEPRPVRIDLLELVDWDASDPARPIAVLDVLCSAGMYVRALARDLGRAVGSAAYLGALTRTGSGAFSLEMAHDLDAIRSAAAGGPEGLRDLLLPLDAGLEAMPPIPLTPAEVAAVARGQFVRPLARTSLPPGPRTGPVRLIGPDGLVAIAEWEGPRLVPHKVLVDPPGGPARSRT
ncbi:MAG: tRNA pseudouridine synthase B [Chloroflexota bacterium]|nr:MAG: tRNA pseudouridine synthase B [Chloroflexota bacterium]